jgi:hypothetical protein
MSAYRSSALPIALMFASVLMGGFLSATPEAQQARGGQPQQSAPFTRMKATVAVRAGVYVVVPPGPTPLRILEIGTALLVIGETENWWQVEFADPQWGARVAGCDRTCRLATTCASSGSPAAHSSALRPAARVSCRSVSDNSPAVGLARRHGPEHEARAQTCAHAQKRDWDRRPDPNRDGAGR